MTVTEAVTASGITPSADYKGIENTDDFVLAICTEASKKDAVKDWTVCADHVREHSGALNASTSDNTSSAPAPLPPRAAFSAPSPSTATVARAMRSRTSFWATR